MPTLPAIKLTVFGVPRVKKNNQKVGVRNGKPIKYNTKAYIEWEETAHLQLPWSEPAIDYPINLACKFFMDTHRPVDLSALYEGIQDVMVKRGIIKDDNYKIVASHDGSGVFYDPSRPRMEIVISPKA